MTERSNDFDEARVQAEEHFAEKELGLLIYRLQNLPTEPCHCASRR